jgi:hypothetical protein
VKVSSSECFLCGGEERGQGKETDGFYRIGAQRRTFQRV